MKSEVMNNDSDELPPTGEPPVPNTPDPEVLGASGYNEETASESPLESLPETVSQAESLSRNEGLWDMGPGPRGNL